MHIPGWLEWVLRWGMWLFRPKYLAGVFPVCLDDAGRVLLIRKRLGAAIGWQLPGGAKEYGVSLERSACQELKGETGLTTEPGCLVLMSVHCVEAHRDLNFVYLVRSWGGELGPRDTTEIAEARWVSVSDAYKILYPPHLLMLMDALDQRYLSGQ